MCEGHSESKWLVRESDVVEWCQFSWGKTWMYLLRRG